MSDEWQPIETAPKDGRIVLLLSVIDEDGRPPTIAIGSWKADGTSWVDKYGSINDSCYALAVTGVWESEGGWFQPNEVTHWSPIPDIPPPAA